MYLHQRKWIWWTILIIWIIDPIFLVSFWLIRRTHLHLREYVWVIAYSIMAPIVIPSAIKMIKRLKTN